MKYECMSRCMIHEKLTICMHGTTYGCALCKVVWECRKVMNLKIIYMVSLMY